ncbi:unnamed protein product, partial [Rangifer tarandus platyrhynchus]
FSHDLGPVLGAERPRPGAESSVGGGRGSRSGLCGSGQLRGAPRLGEGRTLGGDTSLGAGGGGSKAENVVPSGRARKADEASPVGLGDVAALTGPGEAEPKRLRSLSPSEAQDTILSQANGRRTSSRPEGPTASEEKGPETPDRHAAPPPTEPLVWAEIGKERPPDPRPRRRTPAAGFLATPAPAPARRGRGGARRRRCYGSASAAPDAGSAGTRPALPATRGQPGGVPPASGAPAPARGTRAVGHLGRRREAGLCPDLLPRRRG